MDPQQQTQPQQQQQQPTQSQQLSPQQQQQQSQQQQQQSQQQQEAPAQQQLQQPQQQQQQPPQQQLQQQQQPPTQSQQPSPQQQPPQQSLPQQPPQQQQQQQSQQQQQQSQQQQQQAPAQQQLQQPQQQQQQPPQQQLQQQQQSSQQPQQQQQQSQQPQQQQQQQQSQQPQQQQQLVQQPSLQQPQPQQRQQRSGRNKPCLDLVQGSREDYLKYGVPLYEASIKCNWKAAKAILDKRPELVRYSITENEETPLHVAASAKGKAKRLEEFVKNMVDMMGEKDLELQNKNHNTALYLAAVAGNLDIVKIMVKENKKLLTIPGANRTMMPLYGAALFGNKDVVKYIYEESKILSNEDGWSRESRGWLLERCVENNMFDTALKIVKKYSDLESGNVLRILAGKPEAFREIKSNIISRTIKSVFAFICFKKAPKVDSDAVLLLRSIWGDILKKPKKEIDTILRGPPDSNPNTKIVSGWAVKAMQLQKVIYEHVEKMDAETKKIKGQTHAHLKLHKLISQSLVNMHVETQNIIKEPSSSIRQGNKPISNREHLALELQRLVFKHITYMDAKIVKIMKSAQTGEQLATQLEEGILKHIKEIDEETQRTIEAYANETHPSRVLFIAAQMGNTNFLVELIRGYPDLIWKVNDNNQTIFHTAVEHRQEGVYNLLYEIGAMKDLITPLKDTKNNNMLHLVGKVATQKRLEDVSGVALQMQLELLWFKEVKYMIPPSYRERENEDGLTPHELFTKEHKDLVTVGEKWMKGTASQCMVVAALIATIVFAATFTVPGGYNQQDGIPIFHSKATFAVFVVADAISLISSSASILMFLSILTSRYAEYDFLESLPRKLLLGLTTLFLSITTMMVAFGVSFFILYKEGLLWMPILICVFVVFPALLYIWLQYGLFVDVILSTYRTRYLFKPTKQVLYYENPKV